MVKNFILGALIFIAGLSMIISTYKKPEKTFWSLNVGGYLGGSCLVIAGIVIVFREILKSFA